MNKNYQTRLTALKEEALTAINDYNGPKAKSLETGEKAIDMDDAWLIIGKETPILRDKREQHLRESFATENRSFPENRSSDFEIAAKWDAEQICTLATYLMLN